MDCNNVNIIIKVVEPTAHPGHKHWLLWPVPIWKLKSCLAIFSYLWQNSCLPFSLFSSYFWMFTIIVRVGWNKSVYTKLKKREKIIWHKKFTWFGNMPTSTGGNRINLYYNCGDYNNDLKTLSYKPKPQIHPWFSHKQIKNTLLYLDKLQDTTS